MNEVVSSGAKSLMFGGCSDRLVVAVDRKQVEKLGIEHLVLLSKDENDAPKVADQPCVDALVTAVRRHQDVWNLGQKSLKRELLQVGSEGILVYVHNLVRHRSVLLDLLVPIAHRFVVGVLNAALDVTKNEGLTPADEPLSRGVARLHLRYHLRIDISSLLLLLLAWRLLLSLHWPCSLSFGLCLWLIG